MDISTNQQLSEIIPKVLNSSGPFFCNVRISDKHRVVPQVKFGSPIEDSEPFLDRKKFKKEMIIKLIAEI